MNARTKPWSIITIDWKTYRFENEHNLDLSPSAIDLIKKQKNNLKVTLNPDDNNSISIDIKLDWSDISIKIDDILLLSEVNSHKAIIPKFSEYIDGSWKSHTLKINIILKLNNKKAIEILNFIKLYNEYWDENYIDFNIPNIWDVKVHIKYFLLSTSHIAPIDTKKVFISEWTTIKQIIESPNQETWNSDISTIPTKIDFTITPNINLPFEKIIDIKQWLTIPHMDTIKSFTYGWKTYQFSISDLQLTN